MTLTSIDATFSVGAGAFRTVGVDVAGLALEQVASLVHARAPEPQLCHACAHEMSDPFLDELTGFTLHGVEYVQRDGGAWVPAP